MKYGHAKYPLTFKKNQKTKILIIIIIPDVIDLRVSYHFYSPTLSKCFFFFSFKFFFEFIFFENYNENFCIYIFLFLKKKSVQQLLSNFHFVSVCSGVARTLVGQLWAINRTTRNTEWGVRTRKHFFFPPLFCIPVPIDTHSGQLCTNQCWAVLMPVLK